MTNQLKNRHKPYQVPGEYFEDGTITRGSKALIRLRNGSYLFYRRDGNTPHHPYTIDLIGGGAELNETGFETLEREMLEEINVRVSRSSVVYARAYPSEKVPGMVAWFAAVELPNEVELRLGDEGTELIEMSLDEYLARKDVFPFFQDRTRDYLNG